MEHLYFIQYWGPRGSTLFIGAGGKPTDDAAQAQMFEHGADALAAFREVPASHKSRSCPACKVRTRRRALRAA